MREFEYNRQNAIEYARKWAYGRNPKYYNYDPVGGDCTNFISQCIFAGAPVMNYEKDTGWYYINGNRKSPSWTGVDFLYKFLIKNTEIGPYGKISTLKECEKGDIVQLSFNGIQFEHSLIIVDKIGSDDVSQIIIASHTFDNFGKKISEYDFKQIRWVHIQGYRKN